jgi:hypothetical protein
MINPADRFDRTHHMSGVSYQKLSLNKMRRPNKGVVKMERRVDPDCGESRHAGFKHFLPILAIPIVFGLMRGVTRHKFGHMDERGRAEWNNGVPPMFAELHRRAHAAEAEKPVVSEA